MMQISLVFQNEPEFLEDSLSVPGFPSFPSKFVSSEDEFVDSDDVSNSRPQTRPSMPQTTSVTDSKVVTTSNGNLKREFRRRQVPNGWLQKLVLKLIDKGIKIKA